jgi:uncharacterized membrane protein YecN with MAPEG domain
MILPITLVAAGLAALINLWLGIRIGQIRTREKISIGDGGNEALIRRMRAQANFIEFTPIVLILIAVVELAVGQPIWLWVASIAYMLGRIAHAIGMDGNSRARGAGISVTMLVMAGLGLYAFFLAFTMKPDAGEPSPTDNGQETEAVPAG